ncbi:hypothetical protein ACHQM5_015248 [Ranunculus cassubicifolius]
MDSSKLSIIFLLPLILSTTQISANAPAAGKDHIAQACDNAVNEQLCIDTLRADPTSKTADVPGLAAIAIKLAVSNATAITEKIKQLLPTITDTFEKGCLKTCEENYLAATEQLDDTLAAIKSKGYKDATTWIQAAMTDSESCEECYEAKPGYKSKIKDENTMFQQLCGNALAIGNILATM